MNGRLPIVIVGDFNDELEYLLTPDFKKYLKANKLLVYDKNKKFTSYHKYDYTFNVKEGKLVYQGVTENPHQTLDQVIYSNKFKLTDFELCPEKGLGKMEVPYKHKVIKGEITNPPNYDQWPSDHAMMKYQFMRS